MNIEDRLDEVRQEYLQRMTRGDSHLLQEVEAHITARDGKMLRPRMTLLAAASLGHEHLYSRHTLLAAVCVEMLHNTSLIHDDVIDQDLTRRGQPSVNARWGTSVAVLVGDYLMAQIMDLLNEIGDTAVTSRICNTVAAMTEAELLAQELLKQSSNQTIEQYLQIIDGKTARLFATACALGNPAYEEFGLHYGRLFQLRDDIADREDTPFTHRLLHEEETLLPTIKPALSIQI